MTDDKPIDIAIAGGGLAGGLAALALRARRPDLRTVIVEAGESAGGDHLWSCFGRDIAAADRWLIEPLIEHSWAGHDVRFPGHRRRLAASYASLTSARLDAALKAALPPGDLLLGARIASLSPGAVTLADGRVLPAGAVIDARGFARTSDEAGVLDLGWQKFVGLHWHCAAPHGIARPIVMDATVDQAQGYRFVYVLPFTATELFIEDTYYTAGPELDVEALKRRIAIYAGRQGWSGGAGERVETGVLPVCMGGDIDRLWAATSPGIAKIGMRGGFFHAMTGYSLPDAVRVAIAIARMRDLSGAPLHDKIRSMARAHWRGQAFYRMLATMLFRAAQPDERWQILARFYRLDPALIERFYAGRSSLFDKLRILTGKPPVPIRSALEALGRAPGAQPS